MTQASTQTGTGLRIVGLTAITLAILFSALGVWLHGAGSALAPGPAKLSAALSATPGATAAAVYLNTTTPTTVRYYSSSWTSDSTGPAAGTPCSSVSLAKDAISTHVIAVNGVYRRCI